MACLGKLPFTVTAIERSVYEDKPSVVVTTKEKFKGKDLILTEKKIQNMTDEQIEEFKKGEYNKFHSSRIVVAKRLLNEDLMKRVNGGEPLAPIRHELVKNPKRNGNPYWELIDA